MTNKKNNVDASCCVNFVVLELARFYNQLRTEIQIRMGVGDSTHPDNQPLLLQDNVTVYTAAVVKTVLA
jgi:hypothetical protein